jgi:dTDP-4-dehydrorhamnose reductase
MIEPSILLLGANGQVGYELSRALGARDGFVALDRAGADLSRPESLRAVVLHCRPKVIINAAAYTAVDQAESEPDLARDVNAVAPGVLAKAAEEIGACIVHYSTDYVFDGRKGGAYVETDSTNPLSVYGRTKLAGEDAVRKLASRHLVFRTSWLLGVHGRNFLKTILRLAAERETLNVVADQYGAPTSAELVADVTARVLQSMLSASKDDRRWGVYHLAAAGKTSWHGCARYVVQRARELGISLKATPEAVVPISTVDYPAHAARPANSRLNTEKLRAEFGIKLPDWKRDVDRILHQLNSRPEL